MRVYDIVVNGIDLSNKTFSVLAKDAKVEILHQYKRKALVKFLDNYTRFYWENGVGRCRTFSKDETCVTLTRLLWKKPRCLRTKEREKP